MPASESVSQWLHLLFRGAAARRFPQFFDRMEGETAPEIAIRLDRAVSSVERRPRLIRKIWESEDQP